MVDDLTKLIPFLGSYPLWARIFILFALFAVVAVAVLVPRSPSSEEPVQQGSPNYVQQASSGRDTYQINAKTVTIAVPSQQPAEPPLKDRLRSLLRRINPDIIDAIDTGQPGIQIMISISNQADLQKLQREDEFTDYLSVRSTGSVILGGTGNKNGGSINDTAGGMMNGFELTFREPLRAR